MRKYYIFFAISVVVIWGLQAKYFLNLYEIFRLYESQKIEKAIFEAIDLECHHRSVDSDSVEYKTYTTALSEIPQEILDSLNKTSPAPKRRVYDIMDLIQKEVISKKSDLHSQIAQDNQFEIGRDVNLRVLDSLLTIRLDKSYERQILLFNGADDLINLIGYDGNFNYESRKIPLGTNNYRKVQFMASIPVSNFLKDALWSLILAFIIILVPFFVLIFFIATIRRDKNILEVREQSINGVIHDLKSPLINMSSMLDVLLMVNSDNQMTGIIKSNQTTIQNMTKRIEYLLDAVRNRNGKILVNRERVSAASLVDRVFNIQSMLEQTYRGKDSEISIIKRIENDLNIDVMHFDTIVLNMLDNSIKYSKESVKINLYLENTRSGGLAIVIVDDGLGIERKYHKHIFRQSYRLSHKEIAGHGIGLYLVRSIARAHGGDVRLVNSKIGEGSEFIITLNNNESYEQ